MKSLFDAVGYTERKAPDDELWMELDLQGLTPVKLYPMKRTLSMPLLEWEALDLTEEWLMNWGVRYDPGARAIAERSEDFDRVRVNEGISEAVAAVEDRKVSWDSLTLTAVRDIAMAVRE